ncbi:hypothetical protein [Butyrivibrio sp. M55]|uniref:hypothetical protein n=1 Tax=Butyrivibrio sp. M55 TaxID=1855323 RepID=UPI0008EBD786|nr:hypothetical protein [Butyrivibrio sp. M55]SFU92256.1 hypothetical protein SAMN05216540_12158 [Butyrivibrio sp. M55]
MGAAVIGGAILLGAAVTFATAGVGGPLVATTISGAVGATVGAGTDYGMQLLTSNATTFAEANKTIDKTSIAVSAVTGLITGLASGYISELGKAVVKTVSGSGVRFVSKMAKPLGCLVSGAIEGGVDTVGSIFSKIVNKEEISLSETMGDFAVNTAIAALTHRHDWDVLDTSKVKKEVSKKMGTYTDEKTRLSLSEIDEGISKYTRFLEECGGSNEKVERKLAKLKKRRILALEAELKISRHLDARNLLKDGPIGQGMKYLSIQVEKNQESDA